MTVCEAVGVLAAGHSLSLADALAQIYTRAMKLGVACKDIAEFVLWRGVLPD